MDFNIQQKLKKYVYTPLKKTKEMLIFLLYN